MKPKDPLWSFYSIIEARKRINAKCKDAKVGAKVVRLEKHYDMQPAKLHRSFTNNFKSTSVDCFGSIDQVGFNRLTLDPEYPDLDAKVPTDPSSD